MDDKLIATNRKAQHDFTIIESLEVGIALKGTEVKSVRAAKVNLKDSFATIEGGEVYLRNMHISPYEFGNIANVDSERVRKLLLHKTQINRLNVHVAQKGFTLVPLKIYLKKGLVKVELALCRGKKVYDKREAIKERQAARDMQRVIREKKR